MAYVVARPGGRFEIRESVHTPKGPRARSLANFAVLTDDVLDRARKRASRPFDADAVRVAAERAAAGPPESAQARMADDATVPRHERPENRHFVEASRRMVRSLERVRDPAVRRDPGDAFIDLMGVVAQVAAFRPRVPREPLRSVTGAPSDGWQVRHRGDGEPGVTDSGQRAQYGDLLPMIVSLHELLESAGLPHQFGGAIALIWYRDPRATTDIDINITLPPAAAGPVLELLGHLGVTTTLADVEAIALDGQVRLDWGGTDLDVFFATSDFHQQMAEHARIVRLGLIDIPILAPEDLIVCKAIYDRPKDWLDIEEMLRWGTEIDASVTLDWIAAFVGDRSEQAKRLASLIGERA